MKLYVHFEAERSPENASSVLGTYRASSEGRCLPLADRMCASFTHILSTSGWGLRGAKTPNKRPFVG